jgi:hypothetical protein
MNHTSILRLTTLWASTGSYGHSFTLYQVKKGLEVTELKFQEMAYV